MPRKKDEPELEAPPAPAPKPQKPNVWYKFVEPYTAADGTPYKAGDRCPRDLPHEEKKALADKGKLKKDKLE